MGVAYREEGFRFLGVLMLDFLLFYKSVDLEIFPLAHGPLPPSLEPRFFQIKYSMSNLYPLQRAGWESQSSRQRGTVVGSTATVSALVPSAWAVLENHIVSVRRVLLIAVLFPGPGALICEM